MDKINELKIALFDMARVQRDLQKQFNDTEKLRKPLIEELARLEKEKAGEK